MSDFAKFCPKCYAFFSDPDLFAKHVEVCGFAKKTADSKQQSEPDGRTAAEKKATDRKRQTSAEAKKSQEQGVRSPSTESKDEQNGAGNESPDPLSHDASTVYSKGGTPPADSAPQAKPSKFKT